MCPSVLASIGCRFWTSRPGIKWSHLTSGWRAFCQAVQLQGGSLYPHRTGGLLFKARGVEPLDQGFLES